MSEHDRNLELQRLRDQVAALQQLQQTQEQTALEQTARLEQSLQDVR